MTGIPGRVNERSPPKSRAKQKSNWSQASPEILIFLSAGEDTLSPEMYGLVCRRSNSSLFELTKSAMYRKTNPARTLPMRRPMTREERLLTKDSFAASMVVRMGSGSAPARLSTTWRAVRRRNGLVSTRIENLFLAIGGSDHWFCENFNWSLLGAGAG